MTDSINTAVRLPQGVIESRRQEAPVETEPDFRAMINALPVAIYATDAEGFLTHFNPAAVELCGRAPKLGMDRWCPSWKLYHPDGRTMPHDECPMAATMKRGCSVRGVEALLERPDGTRVLIKPYPMPLRDADGKIVGGVNMVVDITERSQVEAELTKAKAGAEKATLAKSDFLSNMSHELRSPLNAILGFAQLMESDAVPQTSAQKESTGQILQAGWYLLDLINEILDLALIESGRVVLSKEPMSLGEVVLDVQAMIEPQAQKSGITMKFCHFDKPSFVLADRTRVKQILINLLSNAIKYNHVGGAVDMDCAVQSGERIRISVEDTGPGLSPEKLAQLFQPFNRLGQENSNEEGTGIGLVMTKRLVELMGGAIGVDSTVGKGSVFWVELVRASEPALAHDAGVAEDRRPARLQKPECVPAQRTLLYVEDNPANLRLVEQLIARRPNLCLLSAREASFGLELAREHRPDVILMDINLPGISGIRALKILREDPRTLHIPVIAISANAMPHDISRGLDAGFFRYLTKPIKVNQFMDALDEALDFSTVASVGGNGKGAAP